MTRLRAVAILVVFAIVTLAVMPVQWAALKLGHPARKRIPHRYHRFLCRLFGMRIKVLGSPREGGVLMTANHAGWLDIPILSAVAPVSFVSKEEVGRWPFFGALARLQRTVFTRRERAEAANDCEAIRQRLREGDALVIFPEGTSSDGNRVLPFRSALLSAAELTLKKDGAPRACAPVQPVSVAYVGLHGLPMGRENRPLFAWYGDMELIPHIWEAMKAGPLDVTVEFHPALTPDAAGGRKALAAHCEAAVRAGLIRALCGAEGTTEAAPKDEMLIEALTEMERETEEAA